MKRSILIFACMLIGMSANASNMSTEFMIGHASHDHDTKVLAIVEPFTVLYEEEDMTDKTLSIRQTFRMSDRMAFEIGYHDLGQAFVKGIANNVDGNYYGEMSVDVHALTIGFKGGYDFDYGLGLYSRIGLAKWRADVEREQSITPKANANDSDIDPYFGLEANYSFINNVYLGIQHTIYPMNSEFSISGMKIRGKSTIKDTALVIGFHY